MNNLSSTPTQQVAEWLSTFAAALDRADTAAALALFADECYWRDLVSFTWNIKTLEGRESIQAMLQATLPEVRPASWRIAGEATSASGVTEAWFTFETALSRPNCSVKRAAPTFSLKRSSI